LGLAAPGRQGSGSARAANPRAMRSITASRSTGDADLPERGRESVGSAPPMTLHGPRRTTSPSVGRFARCRRSGYVPFRGHGAGRYRTPNRTAYPIRSSDGGREIPVPALELPGNAEALWKQRAATRRTRSGETRARNTRFAAASQRSAAARSAPRRHRKEAGSSPPEGSEKPPAKGGFSDLAAVRTTLKPERGPLLGRIPDGAYQLRPELRRGRG
jgi:hypothetical protein